MTTEALWQIVLADLEIQVGRVIFQTFISQTKLLSLNNETAVIGCNQPLLISLIEKRYSPLIKKTLDNYTKIDTKLVFTATTIKPKKSLDGPLFTIKNTSVMPIFSIKLNPDYTFENFAVSSSNQMAHAAATAVANAPSTSYNPLFLYGGVGVGKTHLMQAIGHELLKTNQEFKIIYCTGEDFTNDIIEAIRNKTTVTFKKKYRKLDVLLIDDIQFIAGKNTVQEEFFHTFNAIQQSQGQIVMTSDRSPEEINKLEERLKSRFEGGLTIDIGAPDFELRTAILLIKAKQRNITLPITLAKIIAANVENPRKLDGVLIRILTESQMNKIPIDEELVKKVLGKTVKETKNIKNIKPEKIMETVASYFNLKLSQLKGNKRDRSCALPRQILYFLLRSELKSPLTEIGDLLGGRDHTTVLHGVRKISALLSTDENIRGDVLGIKQRLFG
jgi:chromosomal replication initiator protein